MNRFRRDDEATSAPLTTEYIVLIILCVIALLIVIGLLAFAAWHFLFKKRSKKDTPKLPEANAPVLVPVANAPTAVTPKVKPRKSKKPPPPLHDKNAAAIVNVEARSYKAPIQKEPAIISPLPLVPVHVLREATSAVMKDDTERVQRTQTEQESTQASVKKMEDNNASTTNDTQRSTKKQDTQRSVKNNVNDGDNKL